MARAAGAFERGPLPLSDLESPSSMELEVEVCHTRSKYARRRIPSIATPFTGIRLPGRLSSINSPLRVLRFWS